MKILWEGKIKKPVTFECDVCGCKFIAGQGEYKYKYRYWDETEVYECECPYCKSLIWREIRLS